MLSVRVHAFSLRSCTYCGVAHPLSYGRAVKLELGDKLASPVGWHTLPYERDPSISPAELKAAKARGGNLGSSFPSLSLTDKFAVQSSGARQTLHGATMSLHTRTGKDNLAG